MSGGGSPPPAPDYVRAAREQGQQNIAALRTGAALNRVNQVNPYGSTSYRNLGGDQWEQTTQLSEDQQRLLDQQEGTQLDMGRIAGLRLGQVGGQGDFSLNGLPSRVTGVGPSNLQSQVGAPGPEQRQHAEDAIYRMSTRHLDPQFQQREESTRTRLINQGLREGSEAWNTEMANLDRDRQAAYGDARDRSIAAGGAEASRMLSDDLSRAGFANQTEGQRFGQALTNAQLQNEGRQAGIDERLTQRDVPLREFMSLYGGGAPAQLNAPGVANVGSPEPVDYMGAINQQYGAQTDMYNYRQQRNAQNTQTGVSLASLAAMFAMASDRRMKRDIERIGTLPNGLPTYRFKYIGEDRTRFGVMSDDVRKVMPEAVIVGPDGFDRVNYAAIGAVHLLEAD